MQFVVRNRAIEFNGVFQFLHRDVQTFEEQAPRLAGNTQRFETSGFLARTGQAQFDALRHQLLDTRADQTTQMLAVTEHVNAIRWRGILMHFAQNRF